MSNVRTKRGLLPFVGVGLLAVITLGNAAASMMMTEQPPTKAERWAEERDDIVKARRAEIVALRAQVDHCEAANAHELARLLVMDGRFDEVFFFAQGYQAKCGADPVVEHWGRAPRPRAR